MTVKVIQIWDICGIAGLLAKYLERYFDYDTIALARKSHDPFLHTSNKTLVWDNRAIVWLVKAVLKARSYDIIHLHSGITWLPYFRMFYPRKKIVLHLHGTKIRGRWHEEDLSKADLVLVSTPDLLDGSPEGTLYLPNPVDEDLINHINLMYMKKIKKTAFHVERYALDKAQEYALSKKLKLVVSDRDKTPMNHKDFLKHMARYEYFINVERSTFLHRVAEHEYYVDVKRDYPKYAYQKTILNALSLTGLEALALGCKVINWDNEVLKGLPKQHQSKNVASRLHEMYQSMEEKAI